MDSDGPTRGHVIYDDQHAITYVCALCFAGGATDGMEPYIVKLRRLTDRDREPHSLYCDFCEQCFLVGDGSDLDTEEEEDEQ